MNFPVWISTIGRATHPSYFHPTGSAARFRSPANVVVPWEVRRCSQLIPSQQPLTESVSIRAKTYVPSEKEARNPPSPCGSSCGEVGRKWLFSVCIPVHNMWISLHLNRNKLSFRRSVEPAESRSLCMKVFSKISYSGNLAI